jgi:3-dehydroquinate dehydratase-2
MKIIIINGPNLNLLGIREKHIYGDRLFTKYLEELREQLPGTEIEYFQSNHEGALIDKIHETGFEYSGIVLNAGAYTHTSIALRDAIASVECPVVEVHVSNVFSRESFRHESMISPVCKGVVAGFGFDSYRMAVEHLVRR